MSKIRGKHDGLEKVKIIASNICIVPLMALAYLDEGR